jgi:hypothetical protein
MCAAKVQVHFSLVRWFSFDGGVTLFGNIIINTLAQCNGLLLTQSGHSFLANAHTTTFSPSTI